MSIRRLSRRSALRMAGAVAAPGILFGCSSNSASTSPNGSASSDLKRPESMGALQDTMDDAQGELQRSEFSETKEHPMQLGAFSISLAVKDLEASRKFYESLGFKPFAGNPAQNWQILKNGDVVIGLFQGMFDKNIITFNPGWDQNAQKMATFTDVRELQRQLKAQGVKLTTEADENSKGPASFTVVDPDGNAILFDQHV